MTHTNKLKWELKKGWTCTCGVWSNKTLAKRCGLGATQRNTIRCGAEPDFGGDGVACEGDGVMLEDLPNYIGLSTIGVALGAVSKVLVDAVMSWRRPKTSRKYDEHTVRGLRISTIPLIDMGMVIIRSPDDPNFKILCRADPDVLIQAFKDAGYRAGEDGALWYRRESA